MPPNHLVDAHICQPILKENWKNVILWSQDLVNMHAMIRSHVLDFQQNLHKKPKIGFQIIVVKTEASLLFKLCV
jgi:hypothetical protein